MHTDTLTQTHTHVHSYAHTHTYTGAVPIVAGEPLAHRMRAWQKLLPIVLDEGDDVGAFPQARLGFTRLVRLDFCAYQLHALT